MFRAILNKIIFHRWLGKLKSQMITFSLAKKQYHYFYHLYNSTWCNERNVEIPITWAEVEKYNPDQVLEVGNVLAHYFPIKHQVIDKYEKGENVKNIDIVDLKSKKKYDLIVSISTLEHVGWDEKIKDPKKINQALDVLTQHLNPGGKLLVTFPLGYNPNLDKLVQDNKLKLDKIKFLKRTSIWNTWQEVSKKVLKSQPKYGSPFPNANVIGVGERVGK